MAEAERFYTTIVPVTITNGASLSPAVALERAATGKFLTGLRLVGIYMPAAWTAAAITFQGGAAELTPQDIYDKNGSEYTVTVAAGHMVVTPPLDLLGIDNLVVRSGTGATPVNQGADRTLYLLLRQL